MYTLHEDIKRYEPVLALTQIISQKTLHRLRVLFFTIATLSGVAGLGLYTFEEIFNPILFGTSLLFAGLWVEQILIISYFNSYYFYGLNSIIGRDERMTSGITFEVAETINANKSDITEAFCRSKLGNIILLRAGVDQSALQNFLNTQRHHLSIDIVPLPNDRIFTMIDLGRFILQQDPSFLNFLKEQGVTEENFIGALGWVMYGHFQYKRIKRWWSKDNLAKIPSIGRDWSFGNTFLLQKFSRGINTSSVFSTLTQSNHAFKEEKIKEIEIALTRTKASNVLIIGEAGVGTIDLLMEIKRRMGTEKALSAVENKQMILLDTNHLFALYNEKQTLEITLLNIFVEALKAGNVIIIIENISNFIKEAGAMGISIPELIDPFLANPSLHIIGTDTPTAYHNLLEPLGGFTRRFAEVLIDEPNLSSVRHILQDIAVTYENRYQTFFTYPAIKAVAESADRYLMEGVMPDKAIELLSDIAVRAKQANLSIINSDFVYQAISEKTGVPVGPIDKDERDLLLNLESRLHERVIGQHEALSAIAKTMRRARAGIQASDKPIGSFLFLGPTGVGKTETAKALAYLFFGDEGKMHRLDMSEFSSRTNLQKLVGDENESGILSDMLNEQPYSVLLLDEFEKSSQAVQDLFLQILDEGIFTDSRGDKINARNTIIIATSNAGSDLILRTIEQRKELSTLNQEIINHIIKEGVYRPELINRFDNVIIFEPLTLEEQGQVANLMLRDLYERIKDRGFDLTISRDLMEALVEKGYNPQFGARPMRRVIQDIIEEKIAQKIISGEVQKGDSINITKSDFSDIK
jgi:ATP-dependent Clp protease ATP-binding subunit ClpC